MFFNFSTSSREPDDKTIFDADDPSEVPNLDIDTEHVYNFELGGNYRGDKYNLGLNLFWMEFRNEIVEQGALDNDGYPIMGNADQSVHSGVEFTGNYRPLDFLTISGNFSYNDNKFKKYIEYINSNSYIDYSDNPVPGFPTYLGNLIIDYNKKPFRVVYRLRAVGKQYIESAKSEFYAIGDYTVSSLSLSAYIGEISGMGRFSLTGRINNLFNKLYETAGVVDWGEGYYFPAAERNFFIELKWDIE